MTTRPVPVPREGGGRRAGDTTPIRVLCCIPTLGGGGAERQVRLLLPEFARRGVSIALLTRFAEPDIRTLTNQGVQCIPIESRGNYNPKFALEYLRAIRTFRPNIIQSFLTQMDIICGALPSHGAHWILSERSSKDMYGGRLGRVEQMKNGLRSWLGGKADLVIANSPSGLQVWHSHQSKLVIPNAIDFEAIESADPKLLSESNIFAGRRVLLSVGRLSSEKRMAVLIETADIVRRRIPNFQLVIVGEGPERGRLEALINERGLANHVQLVGFRDDVICWLKSADIFASASSFEGQPNAVMEAAAAGVPMILSDIRQHHDLVGEGAVFPKAADAENFAEAVVALLNSHEAAERLQIAARGNVKHLSVPHVVDRYLDTYRRIVTPEEFSG